MWSSGTLSYRPIVTEKGENSFGRQTLKEQIVFYSCKSAVDLYLLLFLFIKKWSAQENTKTAVTVLFIVAKLWKNTIIELKLLHKLGLHKIEWYSALKTGKLTSHKRHIYNIEKYYWVKEQSLKNIQGYKSNMLHFGRGSAKEEVWWLSGLTKLTIEKAEWGGF